MHKSQNISNVLIPSVGKCPLKKANIYILNIGTINVSITGKQLIFYKYFSSKLINTVQNICIAVSV